MKWRVLILSTIILSNCDNSKQIKIAEQETPTTFLSIKETPWVNGSDYIEGTLANSASKTDYANIVMIVQFYSTDGSKIGTERIVEFEILKSGENRTYKHNIHPPSLTGRLEVIIDRAQFVD
jgi:hypothetical protein